jgi:hypothetical protein
MPQGQNNAAKTHCAKGHEYTPENTHMYEWKPGLFKRHCIACSKSHGREMRLKNYSMTQADFDLMMKQQDYRCAICRGEFKSTRDTHIDHDHRCCDYDGSCGQCVRGILCGECNRGLARFKDDSALLVKAAEYVIHGGIES